MRVHVYYSVKENDSISYFWRHTIYFLRLTITRLYLYPFYSTIGVLPTFIGAIAAILWIWSRVPNGDASQTHLIVIVIKLQIFKFLTFGDSWCFIDNVLATYMSLKMKPSMFRFAGVPIIISSKTCERGVFYGQLQNVWHICKILGNELFLYHQSIGKCWVLWLECCENETILGRTPSFTRVILQSHIIPSFFQMKYVIIFWPILRYDHVMYNGEWWVLRNTTIDCYNEWGIGQSQWPMLIARIE